MIHQKLEKIRRFESGKGWSVVMVAYSTELSTIYGIMKQKGQLLFIIKSSERVKDILQSQTLKEA
jgi:hypothetical protein